MFYVHNSLIPLLSQQKGGRGPGNEAMFTMQCIDFSITLCIACIPCQQRLLYWGSVCKGLAVLVPVAIVQEWGYNEGIEHVEGNPVTYFIIKGYCLFCS